MQSTADVPYVGVADLQMNDAVATLLQTSRDATRPQRDCKN